MKTRYTGKALDFGVSTIATIELRDLATMPQNIQIEVKSTCINHIMLITDLFRKDRQNIQPFTQRWKITKQKAI